MPVLKRLRACLGLLTFWAVAGCSPRAVPDRFPTASAVSVEAPEAPSPPAAVALREDPPLPGEASTGWSGLASEGATTDPHAHHRHGMTHGDAGAPAQPPQGGHAHGH